MNLTRRSSLCSGFAHRKTVIKPFGNCKCKASPASRLIGTSDEFSVCPVSYSSTGSSQRAMPAAALSVFKALERDTVSAIARSRLAPAASVAAASTAAESALDTLCLVTYSDDEDALSVLKQRPATTCLFNSSIVAAAAAATLKPHPGKAGAVFAALCSEDHSDDGNGDLPAVMETLCMLSYDEEAA